MNVRRRLTFVAAAVFLGYLGIAFPSPAGDVTYPMLNNQTTVQDTDLLAVWRASGPLAKVNASVLAAYLQAKFNAYYLQPSNNLSDLGNLTTARSNLGLGSAALANTGTSGTALCQLNQNCAITGAWSFNAAPFLPVNTTTTPTLRFQGGSIMSTPSAGAFESDGIQLFFTKNTDSTRHSLAYTDGSNFSSSASLSIGSLNVSGATTLSGVLGVTGLVTASNGIVASPNGTGPAVDATGPGSGSTGGVRVRAGATGDAIIQFTNNGGGGVVQWGYLDVPSSGAASWNGGTFSAPSGFSGNITGTTASFSGASSFGSTLGVTGLATFNGGITDTGNLSVTGTTTHTGAVTANGGIVATGGTLPGIDAQTPNNSSTGGVRIRANATSSLAYLQITDSSAGNEWGSFKFQSGAGDTGPATWNGGLFTFNSALTATGAATLSGGLTVSGALTLPAASVANSFLDTVDTTPGTCGSATTTCVVTFNAQGRASNTTSATIQPDTCSAGVNGYCKNAEGIITQWGVYDCGSSACWSSTATITINLPTTCPNGFFSTQATGYNPGGVSSPRTPTIVGVGGSPVNQLYVRGDGASDEGFYWTLICH